MNDGAGISPQPEGSSLITSRDWTAELLADVNDWAARRVDVAMSYAAAIRYERDIDWPRVNAAIIEKWSKSGLEWIKREAWKRV